MAINVSLKASNTSPTIGDKVTITATPKGQADGSTLAYAWTVDGKSVDGTAASIDYTPSSKGDSTIVAKVTATTTGDNPTTDNGEGSLKLTTSNKQFSGLTVTATVDKAAVKVGDTVTFTGNNNAPKEANVVYSWQIGGKEVGTGKTFSYKFAKEETINVTLVAKVTEANYDDATVTSEAVSVAATEPDYDKGTVDFYNPLPQRNSVFYRAGWWVMDLIEKCVANKVDWTDPDANKLKYADELRTIAKLVNEFDNVEIQESRNGRIIGKDAIKAGKIYKK